MTEENPYAPPESATEGSRVKGDPKTYRIHDDLLYVTNGAILPDVCLETGRVDGGMMRVRQQLKPMPDRAYLFVSLGLFLGVGLLKLFFLPWLIIAGFFTHLYFRRSIEVNLCSSRKARSRQKYLEVSKMMMAAGIVIFIGAAPFDPLDRFVFGLGLLFLCQFLLRRMNQSFRVVEIKGEVASLGRVHPEALRQLERWRRAHLSKLLPRVPDETG